MKTLAIIAEYNPFHNGHAYQLAEALKFTGADNVLTIMSGNFLQRGEPAMWNKYLRAKMCVQNGIDLALELPFIYSTGSALDFANGAIHILNALQSVDYLCFGIENGTLDDFLYAADIIVNEPAKYREILTDNISMGLSYPAARSKALTSYTNDDNIADIISTPNNILALEYICALQRTKSSIKPVPIIRKGAGYHDKSLNKILSSATAIRKNILSQNTSSDMSELKHHVPSETYNIIFDNYGLNSPIEPDDLSTQLQLSRMYLDFVINENPDFMPCDMNNDIYNKLRNCPMQGTVTDIVQAMSSKNYTSTRIKRSLLHMIACYREADRKSFIENGYCQYVNILSLKKDNKGLLKTIKNNSCIPIITKKADFFDTISQFDNINRELATLMWRYDTNATELYNCLVYNKYHTKQPNDYVTVIPVI